MVTFKLAARASVRFPAIDPAVRGLAALSADVHAAMRLFLAEESQCPSLWPK